MFHRSRISTDAQPDFHGRCCIQCVQSESNVTAYPEQREVELKYRVEDQALLASLRQQTSLVDGYRLGPLQSQKVLDVYWDTAAYALTRGGFGLRIRRQNSQWLVTLKSLEIDSSTGLADRPELETELDQEALLLFAERPTLDRLLAPLKQLAWPPPAWQNVVLAKRNPGIRPILLLQQCRDKREVAGHLQENDEAAGELSLDTVRAFNPPLSWSPTGSEPAGASCVFHEVEIEATAPTQAERYDSLARRLRQTYPLVPAPAGKAETALRALAGLDPEGNVGIQPAMAMAEAGRLIWRQQLVELLLNEATIRRQRDEDAVHEMRVAIRRLRAAARIFGPYFKPASINSYLRKLRKSARILGTARDLDVALALLDHHLKQTGQDHSGVASVTAEWKRQRRQAYQAVRAWLTSKSHGRFIADFSVFCHTPGAGAAEALQQQVRYVLPIEIHTRYAHMRAYEHALGTHAPAPLLHALRIEGKRLRYALEFSAPLLAPQHTSVLVQKLKSLQDCLGAFNDAVTLREALYKAGQVHATPSALQPMIDQLDQQIQQARADFAPLWTDFIALETRQQLALAIAQL